MKPEFDFDAATHTYWLDGRRLPSVTQMIQALLPMPPVDDYYLQRGSATHHGCHLFDQGRLDWSTVDPEIEPRIRAWEKFRREFPCTIKANEERFAHPRLSYAGTIDRMLDADDLIVCDLKNSVSPHVELQLAFYSMLWLENRKEKVQSAVAVELLEDGNYRCHWLDRFELKRAEQEATALLTVYNFASRNKLLRKP